MMYLLVDEGCGCILSFDQFAFRVLTCCDLFTEVKIALNTGL
jgi:hypothetical protein